MKENAMIQVGEEILLWRRFTGGDRIAFQEIIVTHYRILHNYGTRFCRDSDFIEDVIQDLFVYLWERKQDLTDTPPSLRNYLLKAFRNRIVFELKQHQRYTDLSENEEESTFEPSIQETLLRNESEGEIASQLSLMLAQLPERQREALYLKYYEDCDIQQISEIMGITRQSVSNHLQKAMTYLRMHWQKSVVSPLYLFILSAFLG
jgi:RNA polymerase sigma factor (sigma-70 family)